MLTRTRFIKYERECLRVLNNYDAVGFYDKDLSPLTPVTKADNYSKTFRSIISPDTGTLTHQEATRMLLGARNALDEGVIDIKDAVLLFLVYESGQRISSFDFLRWKDFYCLEAGSELSWFVDLYTRKGAVEKSPSRISNTTAMLIKAYHQRYEEHARKMGVSGDLSNYQIFIRNSLNGDLFMDSTHVYGWDSGLGSERLTVRLNEILKKLDIPNRAGNPLRFNSNRARHTGATFRVCEGASVKEVQQYLRHRCRFTAQVYIDVASSEIAALIDDAFEGIFETTRKLARRATERPLEVDTSKVVTFFNPHTDEIEAGGLCGYQRRCGDAPFSCVTDCDKFHPFNDAPFDVLLETLKQEHNDYIDNTTSNALTSEYHEAVAKLQVFVNEMKNKTAIEGINVNV
ncbi:tyrosine-type recombinase/integrase [Zhongshania aliphaticivorans]|uniref:tyrosine-type recombinase/integrase n=1 Tax=Zhongshania aliphaticivorans TaxID=1470434 RepID=UPI0025746C48|nr:tyrosine-type recombinase/integrase [Zhongshania aliphaticivorans]